MTIPGQISLVDVERWCPADSMSALGAVGCRLAEWWPWSGAVAGVLAALLPIVFVVVRRRRAAARARPLLVFPMTPAITPARPVPRAPDARRAISEGGKEGGAKPGRAAKSEGSYRPAMPPTASPSRAKPKAAADPPRTQGADEGDPNAKVEIRGLNDGTLQLLPGRLEILTDGAPDGEIRFVRVPGERPEVTFGRRGGPEFRHVHLRSPAVSRLHATMAFDGSTWTIRNESATNPTRVNDHPIDAGSGYVSLADGDRIEMGDIAFIYRGTGKANTLAARSGWHTDPGPRPTNQDAVVVRQLPEGRIVLAVCDGMGSHEAGGRAARAAIEALVRAIEAGGSLEEGVEAAEAAVSKVSTAEKNPGGVGTTLVAALRDGDEYTIVNLGDSRAWRFDASGLTCITRDHSWVEETVADGKMPREEALRSPWKNALTRSLGETPPAKPDFYGPFPIADRHLLILTSDGVHRTLDEGEIAAVLNTGAPVPDLPRHLARRAVAQGTGDNVAVAIIAFPDVAP